jgi:hypothetical protein
MYRYVWNIINLTIALHRDLYVAIIMDRYEGPLTSLTIALHRGLYLAIIMDRYDGTFTSTTIALIEVSTYTLSWIGMKFPTLSLL